MESSLLTQIFWSFLVTGDNILTNSHEKNMTLTIKISSRDKNIKKSMLQKDF